MSGIRGKNAVKKLLLALVATLALSSAAQAQNYPDRPIKMIVSIAAGSVTDVIMRTAAGQLQQRLGQPLVVENQGGASGIVAAQNCKNAAPDGYTICVIYHSTMSYNPLLFTNLPYDPDTDLVPVTRLFWLTEGVFVPTGLNINSIAELKALAQSKPNGLNYATLGEGSFPDLFLRWLNNQWNTQIVGIPYKGGGPAAQAIAANEVQLTRFGVGNFMGLIQAGQAKALAVTTAQRTPLLPDVPTFAEVGFGGYPGQGWWGLAVPKGTPRPIVDKLNAAFVKLFTEPEFMAFLAKNVVVSATTTPEGFAAFLKEDRKAAETLIKIANAKREEYVPGKTN
jgi:tripartite-type tricarboxylate transporter receptor subunit TctC